MRITVAHHRTKDEMQKAVDRAFDDLFKGVAGVPVQLSEERREWQGSVLSFALVARMGLLSNPIKGTVEVTDQEITIDADLGMLERLLSSPSVRDAVGQKIRGLLK